jgi:DNA-binding transcriptional ArsR family regulator
MVKHSPERLDKIFGALSDETRRGMLLRLAQKELNVSELAEPYHMSLAAVSKHLKVLEAADFVERTKDGRNYRCRANLTPLKEISALLEELGSFWRGRLDDLDKFLSNENLKMEKKHDNKK